MAKGTKLDELEPRQLKAVELLINGESISETARLVGVNRKTVSAWLRKDYFKAEMDRQRATLKSKVEDKILTNLNPLLDKLMGIALKSSSDKTSLDAIIYAINRLCGTPTNKTADVSDDKDDKGNEDQIWEELEELDNVVKLEEKKAK